MKKSELKKKLLNNISQEKQTIYNQRLSKSYTKNGISKIFRNQYEEGKGHELNSKFWSKISSSRIAFDLYSWMATDDNISDIQFEKKLVGIKHSRGTSYSPYMDVFIKNSDTIYFIESKFTETPSGKLPESYYVKADKYLTADRKKYATPFPISKRFHGESQIAEDFSNFCQKYINRERVRNDWFDFKQETCHLFGIIFYILENINTINVKNICFANVVYNFDDYTNLGKDNISDFAKDFMKDGEDLVNKIFKYKNIDIKFSYTYNFIQNILEKYKNKIGFGTEKTLSEIFKQYLC